MKVKNPVFKEPEYTKTEKDGVVTFTIHGGVGVPGDEEFEVDGKFSDKKAMLFEGPWPCGDFMPVKNYQIKDPKFAGTGMANAPVCANMVRGDTSAIYADDGETVRYQYKDIDELLAAGWVVD